MLTVHGNSIIRLSGMKYLGATSGAKTSVLCHYFWGQLESFLTVALIKQVACIGAAAGPRELVVGERAGPPGEL